MRTSSASTFSINAYQIIMKNIIYSLLLTLVVASCSTQQTTDIQTYKISSPEKHTELTFSIDGEGKPFYTLSYQNSLVIDTSYLGFELKEMASLNQSFSILNTENSSFDETWEQPWGEEQFIRNNYNELYIQLEENSDAARRLNIRFRVYDYGIGFRYEFPKQENLSEFVVMNELTEFNLSSDPTVWWIPTSHPDRYEDLYRKTKVSEMPVVHTPLTMKLDNGIHMSIHEAMLQDFTSTALRSEGSKIITDLISYDSTETEKAFVTAPSKTPWRTIQLAENAGDLITSYLILNLNEPNKLGDVSWFKPGKYVGIWWEMHINKGSWASGEMHAATTENTKKYIDFASKHGFDGVLVEGWNLGWDGDWVSTGDQFNFTTPYPDYDLAELSRYASDKGVYLIGHHETSANIENYEAQMEDAFQLLEDHGMKAVKTGYVENGNLLTNGKKHHGQFYVDHFRRVIETAAKHKVAVVAHEPIKDTGERRTFPNMISREGARGQEFNAWGGNGGNPANHSTILPFTRMLAGPMDFTPGVFDITLPTKPDNQINTTLAKQLALYVVFYAPMQMACDLPENYEKYPDAFEFIKEVGVDWETSKVLEAEVGEYLTVARKERNSDRWFVGAITNENARETSFKLDFLEEGKNYLVTIYDDGEGADFETNPESYKISKLKVQSSSVLTLKLARSGGAALTFELLEK